MSEKSVTQLFVSCPGCQGKGQQIERLRYGGGASSDCDFCMGRGRVTEAKAATVLRFLRHSAPPPASRPPRRG